MRIVYLVGYFELVGGQELYLARQQAKQGHEVFVVAADIFYPLANIRDRYRLEGFPETELNRRPGRQVFEGITIIRLPAVFRYHDFIVVRGVKRILEELKPAVVFGHEPKTIVPVFGARWKRKFGYVYLLDVHDFFHRVQNHRWWQRALRYVEYFWWRKFFALYALQRADRVLAVAPECRRFLETRHGIPPAKIYDLPLGVETDFFYFRSGQRQSARSELGYTPDDVVLIFSGYMFRRKALESLLDLLAKSKHLPLKLLLVGEGPGDYIRELKEQARQLGVAERVNFFGFVSRDRIAELYSAADIGVWPGNNTLAILEAMGCRLPIIIADMQLAHLAKHGNGLLIPYADIGKLDEAIQSLATSPEKRRAMGLASEQAATQHYSYRALAAQLTRLMEVLADRQGQVSAPETPPAGQAPGYS